MTKTLTAVALSAAAALPVAAERIEVPSAKPVAQTMDALEAAVTGAGARVFARVDHAKGAASVDLQMPQAQTLIFGNPKLGTPAMQADLRAALYLPLKVAVIEAEGGSVLIYDDPAQMLGGLDVPQDAAFVKMMQGALGKLTAKAAQ